MEPDMRNIILLVVLLSSPVYSKGFPDGSDMGTPEMAKCAAAALKIEMKLWKKWHSATEARYAIIYKGKKTPKQIESYTFERIMDKKKRLNSQGIDSKRAYKSYFNNNCSGEI